MTEDQAARVLEVFLCRKKLRQSFEDACKYAETNKKELNNGRRHGSTVRKRKAVCTMMHLDGHSQTDIGDITGINRETVGFYIREWQRIASNVSD